MQFIDLIGQKFGRLTVVGSYRKTNPSGIDEIFWRCDCECGGTQDVRSFSLRMGETKSCGCLRLEMLKRPRSGNLVGATFGRLTVVERVSVLCGSRRCWSYRCLCVCSKETVVQRSKLLNGQTRSCGCLRREMNRNKTTLPRDVAGFNYVRRKIQKGATDRGLE